MRHSHCTVEPFTRPDMHKRSLHTVPPWRPDVLAAETAVPDAPAAAEVEVAVAELLLSSPPPLPLLLPLLLPP